MAAATRLPRQPENHVSTYRPEIDGLRAIAVLSIMLFHAGVPFVPGGYLGVDIFFVISGFLIIGLLLRESDAGGISLRQFYLRRIRRIMPALLLTMIVTTPFAVALMLPDQLQNYGQSVFATVAMANNILLLLTEGYWAEPAIFKPLAHTWSLGVEEQFYLVIPVLMVAVLKWGGRGWFLGVLAALFAASLIWAIVIGPARPNAAFLLLPGRLWELAAGGLVAAWGVRIRMSAPAVSATGWLGLGVMLASLVLFDEGLSTPSLITAIPVAGCALFLWAASGDTGAGRLMARKPLVAIGLVSYSAYLFHQPVFAFVRLMSWAPPPPSVLAALIPLILAASWVSWRWVERPARDRTRIGNRSLLILCAICGTGLAGFGIVMHKTDGMVARWPELVGPNGEIARDNIAYVDSAYRFADKALDPSVRDRNLVVIGDSQARDVINMALEGGGLEPSRIAYQEMVGCSDNTIRDSLEYAALADTIILASGIDHTQHSCRLNWVAQLERTGAGHVVVLGNKQFGWSLNRVGLLSIDQRSNARIRPMPFDISSNKSAGNVLAKANWIDPIALIADPAGRVPIFTPQGRFITQDRLHLTPSGAQWLGEILFAQPQLEHLAP